MLQPINDWYGLVVNDEIVAVQAFTSRPTIFDFHFPIFSGELYEVIKVDIREAE